MRVEKISQQQRKVFDENMHKDRSLEDDMMDSLLGFSRLFKLLVELKKPIVGHNLLLDLMIMYNQFHEQLPSESHFNIYTKFSYPNAMNVFCLFIITGHCSFYNVQR